MHDQLLGITGDALLEVREENARLREELDLVTENNIKLSDVLEEKQELLRLEQDTTNHLKFLLSDVGGKADELESNHNKNLEDLMNQLQAKTDSEQYLKKECEELRRELVSSSMQLDAMHSDVSTHSERVSNRLNALIEERENLERNLIQQQQKKQKHQSH